MLREFMNICRGMHFYLLPNEKNCIAFHEVLSLSSNLLSNSSLSYKETEKTNRQCLLWIISPPTYDNLKHTLDAKNNFIPLSYKNRLMTLSLYKVLFMH